jgi:hypothetical protein
LQVSLKPISIFFVAVMAQMLQTITKTALSPRFALQQIFARPRLKPRAGPDGAAQENRRLPAASSHKKPL